MACGERSSPRSSNRPTTRTSESRWSRIAATSASPTAPPPTIAVRRVSRPSWVQRRTSDEQPAAERQQRHEPDDIEAAEPDAGELVAGLGEERHADHDEEHHRPRARQAGNTASRGRGTPAPGRCRRSGTPASPAPRRRRSRRNSAIAGRPAAPRSRHRSACRSARPARSRSCGRRRRARSATAPAPPARPQPFAAASASECGALSAARWPASRGVDHAACVELRHRSPTSWRRGPPPCGYSGGK